MKKADLIQAICENTGETASHVSDIVEAMLDSLQEALARGEEVRLNKFGRFYVHETEARRAYHPSRGYRDLAARRYVRFSAAPALRGAAGAQLAKREKQHAIA